MLSKWTKGREERRADTNANGGGWEFEMWMVPSLPSSQSDYLVMCRLRGETRSFSHFYSENLVRSIIVKFEISCTRLLNSASWSDCVKRPQKTINDKALRILQSNTLCEMAMCSMKREYYAKPHHRTAGLPPSFTFRRVSTR